MICVYAESHISTSILIIYTFIWIPFRQIAESILKIFTYLFNPHQIQETDLFQESTANTTYQLDLPVSRFQDLHGRVGETDTKIDGDEKEMCSVCLMDFEEDDLVNKLPRCRHVFHVECMEKWLDRCQLTCPLCRTLVLQAPASPSKMWDSSFCILAPHQD